MQAKKSVANVYKIDLTKKREEEKTKRKIIQLTLHRETSEDIQFWYTPHHFPKFQRKQRELKRSGNRRPSLFSIQLGVCP